MTFEGCELDVPLLTKRVKNFLREMEVHCLDDLCKLSWRSFMKRYGVGKGSLENVCAFLKLHGRELREMPPEGFFDSKNSNIGKDHYGR